MLMSQELVLASHIDYHLTHPVTFQNFISRHYAHDILAVLYNCQSINYDVNEFIYTLSL